ncbi:Plasma membrane sulfite pump involved in sulfite metabolism [Orbilia javanica]|uniref:Sulfite efflux pump SSU1 n=1 Tax=Orbilia javanica TaxID=47235 RepID=A0AAN8RLP7_9PEZI
MDPYSTFVGPSEANPPVACISSQLRAEKPRSGSQELEPGRQACDIADLRGWRRVVLHFTPSWFAITMGTGIVSILLYDLPFNAPWIRYIAIVVFCLNIVLFLSFSLISIIRYTMFPGLWGFMIQHPVQSLFIGTFPMGLCTIINMIILVCLPWGEGMLTLAWALWWIDVAISCACCMYMPFVIMHIHEAKLGTMTAAWLLPIVSPIVAAASGALVAGALTQNHPSHALWTLLTSYVLWGCGVPLAMVVLVMYFQRLTLHHLPTPEVIVSVFLPLGPLGSGAFGIMKLGEVANVLLPITGTLPAVKDAMAGGILYILGFAIALVMWGFALVWLFFAVASITRTRFPFNMGFWGFVFPGGVFVLATNQISKELPSGFFKVLTMIFTMIILLLWVFVSVRTIEKTLTGKLIFSPCVQQYQENRMKNARCGSANNIPGPNTNYCGSSTSQEERRTCTGM